MRRLLGLSFAAITAALFSMTMTSCGPDEPDNGGGSGTVAVTGVTLNKTSLSLVEGTSETLTATVAPSNATNKNVSWSSSSTATATVDNTGKVTAVKDGSATITVTTADGSKTATCSVTVTSKAVSVTGISLDKETMEITEGETAQLTAIITPDDATNKEVEWSTSDSKIATVDGTGKITAVASGEATITAKTKDGGKTATCKVTVNAKVIEATGIVVEPAVKEVKEGETFELTVKFLPEGAEAKPVSWRSADDEVATVSNGTVTTLNAGKTKIFASVDGTGIEAFCDLTVTQDPTLRGIAFASDRLGVAIGDPKKLELIFTPSYASNKSVTFSSSNPSVATVNADGIVNGLSNGETTITAKSAEGGFEAQCKVFVTNYGLSSLYWTQNSGRLMLGGVNTDFMIIYNPGFDPEGNFYYAHYDEYVHPVVNKNGTVIHSIAYGDWAEGRKSAAGGGYFFVALLLDLQKNISVLRISDEGEEKVFPIHEGKTSFGSRINDIAADSKGNLYLVGTDEVEKGLHIGTMWTLTVDGKVSKATFGDGSRSTCCYSVATAGSDVWCLVWEGYSDDNKSILAAYKNGKRQYQLCEQVCQQSDGVCDIGIVGNDVYIVFNEYVDNGKASRVEVYKNGKSLYKLNHMSGLSVWSMFVTPEGDTYVSVHSQTESGSNNYIWKNDTNIYAPTDIAFNLFVKE